MREHKMKEEGEVSSGEESGDGGKEEEIMRMREAFGKSEEIRRQ